MRTKRLITCGGTELMNSTGKYVVFGGGWNVSCENEETSGWPHMAFRYDKVFERGRATMTSPR